MIRNQTGQTPKTPNPQNPGRPTCQKKQKQRKRKPPKDWRTNLAKHETTTKLGYINWAGRGGGGLKIYLSHDN